jgi:hypothetical protein
LFDKKNLHCIQEDEEQPLSEPGLSNGVIILAIAIVVGCFAVLWPKIFSPMLFGEQVGHSKPIDEGEFVLSFQD